MKLRLKYLVEGMIKIMLKAFSLFPVKENRVLFQSFSGRQYSDSPRAVSEYLQKEHAGKLEIIWAFIHPENFEHLKEQGIRTVRYKSLSYLYYALTCRVYVDNVEHWSILRFREGQTVINTWHGGGTFKQVGADRRDIGELEKRHVIAKMAQVDWFVSTSEAFSRQTLKGSFAYEGNILECGLPRNDRLFVSDPAGDEKTREALGIKGDHVVLYAPTFRNSLNAGVYDLDSERVLRALKERFGGSWQLLVRSHYYLDERMNLPQARDVSDYDDTAALLKISDVLITDYSSTIWDFALLKKPCFLYCPDLKDYEKERTFYTDPSYWPAIMAEDNEILCRNILAYDEKAGKKKAEEYLSATGSFEAGKAGETVGELIAEICSGD